MYDNKKFKHPGKLRTHWLGPYIVTKITNGGAMKLQKLDGTKVQGLVNGSQQKLYHDNCELAA